MAANGSWALCGGALVTSTASASRWSVVPALRRAAWGFCPASSRRVGLRARGRGASGRCHCIRAAGIVVPRGTSMEALPTRPTRCPCSVVGLWGLLSAPCPGPNPPSAVCLSGRRLWAVSGYFFEAHAGVACLSCPRAWTCRRRWGIDANLSAGPVSLGLGWSACSPPSAIDFSALEAPSRQFA
jgi:hypothetical protein